MKQLVMIAAAVATVSAFARPAAHAMRGDRTTLDSVYTAAQAGRGESLYTASCAKCHGATLAGTDSAGPLAGQEFLASWTGLTLDQLFKKTYETMPSDNPKSIPPKDVADITAYLLAKNQFPAGARVLSESLDSLRAIKIATK